MSWGPRLMCASLTVTAAASGGPMAAVPRPLPDAASDFPAGYIDSPFVTPDGTALYFAHSVASTRDMLTRNPNAAPVTHYLPGHQGQGGAHWWNTDLYVAYRNPDGTWGRPRNLGPTINSEHMECCVWVDGGQSLLIFTREAVDDTAVSGSYMAWRGSPRLRWRILARLPGELGDYAAGGFHDFHMTASGNLYFWSGSSGDGVLYWARLAGGVWSSPEPLPARLQSAADETQPWVNEDETRIYFNRRDASGRTRLLTSRRRNSSVAWRRPVVVRLTGFADPGGNLLWGEPSFSADGTMFFVRFDTSTTEWRAELLMAPKNPDGSYGPPLPVIFKF